MTASSSRPPVALTIAGSDNSAGAGIQADLKTFAALGVYGLTTVTCVVAEVPGIVTDIAPIPPKNVAEQIRLSFEAFPIDALKTGMLFSPPILEAVCDTLEAEFAAAGAARPALVVDPVMVASSGDRLLQPECIGIYQERLLPMATLVTPNLDEAAVLLGRKPADPTEMLEAGHELCRRFGAAFLMKGGHLEGPACDLLVKPDGTHLSSITPRINDVSTHGTGCTFSAAITAGLARGESLEGAFETAKAYVHRAIAQYHRWTTDRGGRTDALNHNAR